MRYLYPDELVGRWAICGHGRLGRITGWRDSPMGPIYTGIRLHDNTAWQTKMPATIHPKDESVLNATFGETHAVV